LFITSAFAQVSGASPLSTDTLVQFAPFVVIFAIMYFLILRPQQQRAKAQREMVQAARRGDVVVTSGGLIGKITKSTDDAEVELEIAPNVRVRLARSGITEVRSKGEPVKDLPAAKGTPPAKKDAASS
jgi:preprotein translocase subunit YajC